MGLAYEHFPEKACENTLATAALAGLVVYGAVRAGIGLSALFFAGAVGISSLAVKKVGQATGFIAEAKP
ncbi:MAG: hypothetical protein PHH11_16880 [Methylomonas sp.]|nr:hypothetical protein [Methylomonas sp.]